MANIHDYGSGAQPLSDPPLGGPNGWCAAVAADLDGKVLDTSAGNETDKAMSVSAGKGHATAVAAAAVTAVNPGGLKFTYHRIVSTTGEVTLTPGYTSRTPFRAFCSPYGTTVARTVNTLSASSTSIGIRVSNADGSPVAGVMVDILAVGSI